MRVCCWRCLPAEGQNKAGAMRAGRQGARERQASSQSAHKHLFFFGGPGLACSAGTARNAHSGVMGHLAGHEVTRNARSPGKLGSSQGRTSRKCPWTRLNRAFCLRKHGKARQGRPERGRNALLPEIRGHFTCKTLQNKAFQAKTTTRSQKKWRV